MGQADAQPVAIDAEVVEDMTKDMVEPEPEPEPAKLYRGTPDQKKILMDVYKLAGVEDAKIQREGHGFIMLKGVLATEEAILAAVTEWLERSE
jgi:hypothetical protein